MRTSPERLRLAPLPRALALVALASSLGACSMFGLGGKKPGATPDNAPTIKSLLAKEVVDRKSVV